MWMHIPKKIWDGFLSKKIQVFLTGIAKVQSFVQYTFFRNSYEDFPGGPVIKTSPSNAGDKDSIAGWRTKIPHAAGQWSPGPTTIEKCACCNEDPAWPKNTLPQGLSPGAVFSTVSRVASWEGGRVCEAV